MPSRASRLSLFALCTLVYVGRLAEAAAATPATDPNEAIGHLMACAQSCIWPVFPACSCAIGEFTCLCNCPGYMGKITDCAHRRCTINMDREISNAMGLVCPAENLQTVKATSTTSASTLAPASGSLATSSTKSGIVTSSANVGSASASARPSPGSTSSHAFTPVTLTPATGASGGQSPATTTPYPSGALYTSSMAVTATTGFSFPLNGSAPTDRTNSTGRVTISGAEGRLGLLNDLVLALGVFCIAVLWL